MNRAPRSTGCRDKHKEESVGADTTGPVHGREQSGDVQRDPLQGGGKGRVRSAYSSQNYNSLTN